MRPPFFALAFVAAVFLGTTLPAFAEEETDFEAQPDRTEAVSAEGKRARYSVIDDQGDNELAHSPRPPCDGACN